MFVIAGIKNIIQISEKKPRIRINRDYREPNHYIETTGKEKTGNLPDWNEFQELLTEYKM